MKRVSTSKATGAPTAEARDYEQMMKMITGFWVTQTVRAIAHFNVADHIAAGVTTPEAIAKIEGTDVDATRRLLRTSASLGLLTSNDGGGHYAPTSLVDTLRIDAPNSLRSFAASMGAPGHWLAWGRFPDAVRTGHNQITAAHGAAGLFEYFAANRDEAALFTEAMTSLSSMAALEVARVLDTSGVRTALDVGGAGGELVQALMLANPELAGGVFDLPHVIPAALAAARTKELQDRFTVVGGDFFDEVPTADLFLLKYILHDWDDTDCVRILKNCREALDSGGRIVVVEHLIGEVGEPGLGPLMDVNMLSVTDGRERQLSEFDSLFRFAGLERKKVSPAGNMYVIELTASA